jgi:hypothetical protein
MAGGGDGLGHARRKERGVLYARGRAEAVAR